MELAQMPPSSQPVQMALISSVRGPPATRHVTNLAAGMLMNTTSSQNATVESLSTILATGVWAAT